MRQRHNGCSPPSPQSPKFSVCILRSFFFFVARGGSGGGLEITCIVSMPFVCVCVSVCVSSSSVCQKGNAAIRCGCASVAAFVLLTRRLFAAVPCSLSHPNTQHYAPDGICNGIVSLLYLLFDLL